MSKAFIAETLKNAQGLNGVESHRLANILINTLVAKIKKDKRFNLPGFGTFRVCKTKAHKALNPRTGEKISVAARKTVRFKVSPVLRNSV